MPTDCQRSGRRGRRGVEDVDRFGSLNDPEIVDESTIILNRLRADASLPGHDISRTDVRDQALFR